MIGPFVFLHSIFEQRVVVRATTDVNNKIVVSMVVLKVICHILNTVSVGFFYEIRSRVSHRNDSISDICEI